MGSLPPGMGQRWGPVVETEDDGTTIHRRPMGGDAAGYLRLIGGPPSDGAAWEAWRVDMDLASPKSGAAAAAAGSTAMPDGADERLAAVAFAGLGLLAVLLLRR